MGILKHRQRPSQRRGMKLISVSTKPSLIDQKTPLSILLGEWDTFGSSAALLGAMAAAAKPASKEVMCLVDFQQSNAHN